MPRRATHFAFFCILSLLTISLHVSSNYDHSFGFPYLSLAFVLAWLHASLEPIDPWMDVLARTTYLHSDRLPDCIAWRWCLFQSYFSACYHKLPVAASVMPPFPVVIFRRVRKHL